MIEFVLSFIILLIIVAVMSLGVMRGRAPISGSCGGLNNVGIGGACDICGGNTTKCEEANQPSEAANDDASNFYDAS